MKNLLAKLYEAQKQMPSIQKNAINPHFKNSYVSLEGVLEVVLPVLNELGLLLLQPPTNVNGQPALRTIIADVESGEQIEYDMMLVLERDNPQGQGSALTYAKRYSILSLLGLTADADDDGQKASTSKVKPLRKTAPADEPEEVGVFQL